MSKLVQLYVGEIQAGNITIDEVPSGLRPQVQAALDALNNQQVDGDLR